MVTTLSTEAKTWLLPSESTKFASTLPNYEEALPLRVNHEGIQNYLKSRGTLNFGDWAIEAEQMRRLAVTDPAASAGSIFQPPPPKVLGPDATRNYLKSRSSTPNLISGILVPPNPHHHFRVKREGRVNYEKNHHSQMKDLLEHYGKLPIPAQPLPHTQGELATSLYYTHKEGHMGAILGNYGRFPISPKRNPHVKGDAAETNLEKGRGHSHLLEHSQSYRPSTAEPHVKGAQAHLNYEMSQGHHIDQLFHEYGKVPLSARTVPKVKYDGLQNFQQAQGNAMRKTLTQCPPSNRMVDRPQSVPLWS